jgi:transposase-like protein
MLEIKTNQLKTRKQVKIDDVVYTVRRMGNIEQLDVQQLIKRLSQLSEVEKTKKLTDKQLEEVDGISKKMGDLFTSLFDDGGDQTKSRKLVASLTDTEITVLLTQIFEEPKDEES